jgi:hypothetical protein
VTDFLCGIMFPQLTVAQLTNELNEREEEKEKCDKDGTRLGAPSGPVMRRGLGL